MNICLEHNARIGTLFAFINEFESRQGDARYEAQDLCRNKLSVKTQRRVSRFCLHIAYSPEGEEGVK